MTPETEVIACPACRHLVRVPLDWLGTPVQCPECKARFRAPVRAGGTLTEPELMARPPAVAGGPKKPDPMLLIPAFGLLFCGFTGAAVNGALSFQLLGDPAVAMTWARNQMPALRQVVPAAPGTPEERAAEDERDAAQLVAVCRWLVPAGLAVGVAVFAGGVSIVRRRHYRFARLACVLAAFNVVGLCCVPGALFGLWGLLMLSSDEGREHFLA